MRMHIRTRMQRRPAHTHRDAHTHTKTGAGDQGSNPALGKQRSRVPDRCPATPTLPDANFRYQEALDWRKWTKGECSSVPSFVRAVLVELSWQLSGTSYDSRRGRPEFEPCLGQAVVTCTRSMSRNTPDFITFATKKLSTGSNGQKEDAASFVCPRRLDRAVMFFRLPGWAGTQ